MSKRETGEVRHLLIIQVQLKTNDKASMDYHIAYFCNEKKVLIYLSRNILIGSISHSVKRVVELISKYYYRSFKCVNIRGKVLLIS